MFHCIGQIKCKHCPVGILSLHCSLYICKCQKQEVKEERGWCHRNISLTYWTLCRPTLFLNSGKAGKTIALGKELVSIELFHLLYRTSSFGGNGPHSRTSHTQFLISGSHNFTVLQGWDIKSLELRLLLTFRQLYLLVWLFCCKQYIWDGKQKFHISQLGLKDLTNLALL